MKRHQRQLKSKNAEFNELKSAFFEWIEKSGEPRFQGFSREHLRVVKHKTPSLNQAINRAIGNLPKEFPFKQNFGGLVRDLRGRFMHGSPPLTSETAQAVFDCIEKIKYLLTLCILQDIGFDLSRLPERIERKFRLSVD
jgi:hypothetical protein